MDCKKTNGDICHCNSDVQICDKSNHTPIEPIPTYAGEDNSKYENIIRELKNENEGYKKRIERGTKENEKLIADIKGLEDKIKTIDDEYQVEIRELNKELQKAQGESKAFEKMVDILRAKSDEKDKRVELKEKCICNMREIIKKLSEII